MYVQEVFTMHVKYIKLTNSLYNNLQLNKNIKLFMYITFSLNKFMS